MKVFALLCLVGCALATSSEWRWQTGKTHVFEYSGRLLSHIPQLAPHYSGLGLNATVLIDVLSANKLQLSLEQPRFTNVNQRLEALLSSGRDGANWREVIMPQMTEVDPQIKLLLEKPIVFEVVRGEIREAKIAKDEPEWSVNLKKALAVLFQAKVDVSSWMNDANLVQKSVSDNFWKTKEQSIDGICEVTYQVNELPKYMVRDRPELVPQPAQCLEDKYFEVVKTKNVDNCERRSSFSFQQPGHYECNGPNCKDMWARTSETRYIACGTRGNLMLQTIINQGELSQLLTGFKTERFVTGTLQTLRLIEVRSGSPKVQPANMTPLKNMMYEYSFKAYESVQQQQEQEQQNNRIPHQVAKDSEQLVKAIPSLHMSAYKQLPKPKIIEEVKTILRSLIKDLEHPVEENAVEKQVTMKVISLARGLAMLKKSEIQTIYREVKPELIAAGSNLFIDAIVMAGTPESVYFLKECIEAGELSKPQIISLLYMLPNSLMFPTEEVLEQVFELVKSPKIQGCFLTRNVAIMSMSTLLEKACLSKNRDLKYPVWVFGKFCSSESPILKTKWIPYLVQELESAQHFQMKNEIIVALGMLPHEEIIGKLIPYVEGRVHGVQHVPRMTRLLALWSLATSGMIKPQTVEPIFYSIYANPAEASEMRIAAFNLLIKNNPPMSVFHKIAARTWTEQDKEVLKVVNSALYTLSQEYWTVQFISNDVFSLPKKAVLVYPLIKKTPEVLPTSGTIFTSQKLEKLGTGYSGMTSWIASNTSFIPLEMYSEIRYFLSQYTVKPLVAGLRVEGAEEIYHKFAELITPLEQGQTVEEQEKAFLKKAQDSMSSEWRKIFGELNIKTRESGKLSGAFYLNMMETTPIYGNFAELTTKSLKEMLVKLFKDPQVLKKSLSEEKTFNLKSAYEFTKFQALIPTDMGLPLIIDLRMPLVLNVQGKSKLELSFNKPSFMLNSKLFYSTQLMGSVGTVNPLTKELVATAIDQSIVFNLPVEMKIELDLPKQSLQIQAKMSDEVKKPIDLVHYHVHPFSVQQKVELLTPLTLAQSKKLIRSRDTLREMKKSFGEYLGLHMSTEVRTESRFYDLKTLFEKLALYKYNPMNMLRFTFSELATDSEGKISLRRHEYSLKFDPIQSSTKSMKVNLKLGYASKSEHSPLVEYKKLKVIPASVQKQEASKISSPVLKALKMLIPVSVESEKVESKSMHPERQEKIIKAMKSLDKSIQSAKAVVVKMTTILEGSSRPTSKSYFATIVTGYKQEAPERRIKTEWKIDLESVETQQALVMKGNLESPILPIWNINELRNSFIDFRFFQTFQVVQAGVMKYHIDVMGSSKVSHEQKEYSKISQEAKLCHKLSEKKIAGDKTILAKLSEPCEAMRQQARTLDEVDFTIKYFNVPRTAELVESVTFDYLKTLLWPYRQIINEQVSRSVSIRDAPVMVRILFNKMTPSFDLTIQRPQENIKFKNIRLPSVLSMALPLKAGVNNAKLIAQKITGHSLYPECKVEDQTLETFDNKTYSANIDYCFNVLAADCGATKQFAVMTRLAKSGTHKQVQINLGKNRIELIPTSKLASTIKIMVDGQEISFAPNTWTDLSIVDVHSGDVQKLGTVFRAPNNVVSFVNSQNTMEVIFDAVNIEIVTVPSLKGKLCGLCGNANQHIKDELEGPQQCMYSKPELLAASYRIKLPQGCDQEKPLASVVKVQLQKENSLCLKEIEIPTKISKSLKTQNGQCIILKHSVVRRPGQICISKKPVTQCATGCQPSRPEPLNKKIPFTCMKEDRVAEHYAMKADRGQMMTELSGRPTSFEAEVPQPISCVPASNYL